MPASGETGPVIGQQRSRTLSSTLSLARRAADLAGVSRLSDVSGLTPFGIPVFQAVRPLALSISVSQGKGLTPMAAMVSALLEAAELHVAEKLVPPGELAPLCDLGTEAIDIWQSGRREPFAIRLSPLIRRKWLSGRCMMSGRSMPVPFDLVALDFTVSPQADAHASSSGLASGNSVDEAAAGAVSELLERDLTEVFASASARERRATEIDIGSIAVPFLHDLIARIQKAGSEVRLWSMGQDHGIAAIRCAISARGSQSALPPTIGSGCHPHRDIATLRAVLEAVQVHATLIAGARDDLQQDDYNDADRAKLELMLGCLSFAPGTLEWRAVPDFQTGCSRQALDRLLRVAGDRSALPVIGIEHDSGVPGLAVFRAIAPGLLDPARVDRLPVVMVPPRPSVRRGREGGRGPVVFIGPTLGNGHIPDGIEQRPPAACGDLTRLLADPPQSVGLVDGCFGTAPSVWHKEILALVAEGIPVFGAASIGALRAAELTEFGMIGIGRIFRAYRDGEIMRDDAVMLVHAPAELDWKALTITLVDAEAAIAALTMPDHDRRMLQRIVRTMPYALRTWDLCLADFKRRTGRTAPVDHAALSGQPSLKLQDAMAMMQILADGAATHPSPPAQRLPMTSSYVRLLAEISEAPLQSYLSRSAGVPDRERHMSGPATR